MFGFARRRRFLDYDYVPLVVNLPPADIYEDETEALAPETSDDGESVGCAAAMEALDAADDRERIAFPVH
jgi:hypothetical protein